MLPAADRGPPRADRACGVRVGEDLGELVDAGGDALGQRCVLPDLEQPFLRGHGRSAVPGEPVEHPPGGGVEVLGGHDVVGQRGKRRDRVAVAGQDHLLGLAEPDVLLQQRRVDHGRDADPDLRQPEIGVLGDDAHVAGQREFEGRAEAVAVDRRHRRARREPRGADEVAHRTDELPRAVAVQVAERVDVHPGGERPAAAGEHDGLRRRPGQQVGDLAQFVDGEGVELVRPFEPDPADTRLPPRGDRGHDPQCATDRTVGLDAGGTRG
nr:hypothetical protein [Saccharopolyspora rosea]